jgi:hypothetical protein
LGPLVQTFITSKPKIVEGLHKVSQGRLPAAVFYPLGYPRPYRSDGLPYEEFMRNWLLLANAMIKREFFLKLKPEIK